MAWSTITREQAIEAFTTEHPPREHQIRGVMMGWDAAKRYDTVCLTGPTGCGKSYIITALTNLALAEGKKVAIYCNRKLVVDQTHRNLKGHGVRHGVRSASMKGLQNLDQAVQICSLQTEDSRVLRSERMDLHKADVVIGDEAHLIATGSSLKILQKHLADGAKLFGITATPVEISHLYKKLCVFATNSEMFGIKALVPAIIKSITAMDVSRIKPVKTGEYAEGDIVRECWSPAIVGHIYKDWKTLNPSARPMLCFAPGVAPSVWVAKEFLKHGVRVAHVDAQDIWIDGEVIKDDQEGSVRKQITDDLKTGRIVGITNCKIYTEAVDIPSLYHLILASPIGARKNFCQAVGRVMRYSTSTPDHCLITDHAGACHRHGSPNQDWDWKRMFHMSEADIAAARKKEVQQDPDKEPITCPKCGLMRSSGNTCPGPPVGCGFRTDKRTRMIVQQSGELVEFEGSSFPTTEQDRKEELALSQKRWDGIYWAAKNKKGDGGMTFNQARAIYKKNFKVYPPDGLKHMPIDPDDRSRKIKDVPWSQLS